MTTTIERTINSGSEGRSSMNVQEASKLARTIIEIGSTAKYNKRECHLLSRTVEQNYAIFETLKLDEKKLKAEFQAYVLLLRKIRIYIREINQDGAWGELVLRMFKKRFDDDSLKIRESHKELVQELGRVTLSLAESHMQHSDVNNIWKHATAKSLKRVMHTVRLVSFLKQFDTGSKTTSELNTTAPELIKRALDKADELSPKNNEWSIDYFILYDAQPFYSDLVKRVTDLESNIELQKKPMNLDVLVRSPNGDLIILNYVLGEGSVSAGADGKIPHRQPTFSAMVFTNGHFIKSLPSHLTGAFALTISNSKIFCTLLSLLASNSKSSSRNAKSPLKYYPKYLLSYTNGEQSATLNKLPSSMPAFQKQKVIAVDDKRNPEDSSQVTTFTSKKGQQPQGQLTNVHLNLVKPEALLMFAKYTILFQAVSIGFISILVSAFLSNF